MRFSSLVLFFSIFTSAVFAQDINCRITINTDQIEGSEQSQFQRLQESLNDFVNNQTWTEAKFEPEEIIECEFLIILKERAGNNYKAEISVQSKRPVYGSTYSTVMLNHRDEDFNFTFDNFQVLQFSPSVHESNLTSTIAFYVYYALGLDFDSFSEKGGEEYFKIAQQIVSNAQSEPSPGWKASEKRTNRYWLVENLLNPRFEKLRLALYEYHINGLDVMHDKVDTGRASITNSLKMLQEVNKVQPNSFNIRVFFSAKRSELIKLYTKAPPAEKNEIVAILTRLDPANLDKYRKIRG